MNIRKRQVDIGSSLVTPDSSGSIPSELEALCALQELYLFENKLTGEIRCEDVRYNGHD